MSANAKHPTFVESVFDGDALDTDIDDFVHRWQQSTGTRSLASCLGFTDDEYALWVEQPASLRTILRSKRHGLQLENALKWDEVHAIAARSMSEGESNVLIKWLRQKGYVQ